MLQRLLPIKNVCISEYFPARNYSTSGGKSLFIGRYKQHGDNYRTLLQFDLSTIQSSNEIQRSYLQLNILRNEVDSGTVKMGIYRLLQEWDDNTITWDSMLPFSLAPEHNFVIPASWIGLIIFDITKLVCSWVDHSYINHGVIMVGEENRNSLVAFHSLRSANSSCWPMLIIT